MSNPITDFLRSQEDRKRLLRIEQLRRQGEAFIKVRYTGNVRVQLDSDGFAYNLRIHGLKDMEAYEQTDENGQTEWKGRKGARMISFYQSVTGDIEADVWDDPDGWNKHFLSTHKDELYVVDDKIRAEIERESNRSFKVELSEEEELERDIADKLNKLESLKKKAERKNGVDKSTTDVDSVRVSRVAARRGRERNTSSVQSGSQDT